MAKNYYEILEVPRSASETEICEAYRRLALKWHPQSNQDNQLSSNYMFHQLAEAYEVLSDPLKRSCYDQYGEFALKEGFQIGQDFTGGYRYCGNASEIFEKFFGNSNPFFEDFVDAEGSFFGKAVRGLNQPKSLPPEDLVVPVECTLEELYNGCSKEVFYARRVLNQDKITFSNEAGVKKVHILPGYSEDSEMVYEGEGHQSDVHPDSKLIFKVKQEPHSAFQRKGHDLVLTKRILLIEAIMAEPFQLKTLDNRVISVSLGEIISPYTKKVVKGEGMPVPSHDQTAKEKGDLIIQFEIEFPKYIPDDKKQILKDILG